MQNSISYKFAIVVTATLFIISNLTAQNQQKIKLRRPPISTETINRLQFSSPRCSTNGSWQKVGKLDWPWVSPEYITGWQRDVGTGSKAGIYISIFPAPRAFHPNEYKNSLYGDFRKEYNALLSSRRFNELDGYQSEEFQINADCGNGLEFREGYTPTTQQFNVVQLERFTENSYYEPVIIIVFTAPTAYFSQIRPEFQSFLDNFEIAPIPDRIPPKLDSVKSISCEQIRVFFNESVDTYSAENAINYSVNSLGILKATIDDNKSVLLKTTSQTDTTYNIVVSNIQDLKGNRMKESQEMGFTGTTKELIIPISQKQYSISFGVFGQKSYYQTCFGPIFEFYFQRTIGLNLGYSINNFDSSRVGYELKNNFLNIGLDYKFIRKDVEKDNGFNIGISGSYGFAQYDVKDTTVANAGRICVCFDADYIYKVDKRWSIKPYLKMGYVKYTTEDETDTDDYSFEDVDGIYNSFGLILLYQFSNGNSLFFKFNQYEDFQPATEFDDSYKYNSVNLGYKINF